MINVVALSNDSHLNHYRVCIVLIILFIAINRKQLLVITHKIVISYCFWRKLAVVAINKF